MPTPPCGPTSSPKKSDDGCASRSPREFPERPMLLPNPAHLTVLIGPGVPVPAPQPVIEALQRVEVNSSLDRSGFQLTFGIGKASPLQLLLIAGYFDPMVTRVVIIVTF